MIKTKGRSITVQMYNCEARETTLNDTAILTNYSINAAKDCDIKLITSNCIKINEGVALDYIIEGGFICIRSYAEKRYVLLSFSSFESDKLDKMILNLANRLVPDAFLISETEIKENIDKISAQKIKHFIKSNIKGDYTIKKQKRKTKKKTSKKSTKNNE